MRKPSTYSPDGRTAKQRDKAYDSSQGRLEDRAFYYSTRWRKFRAWFLSQHPCCEWCEQAGAVTTATQVDHRRPRVELSEEDAFNPALCRPACASCHAKYGAKRGRVAVEGQGAGSKGARPRAQAASPAETNFPSPYSSEGFL
jgi:5-methylcytosine-specific restriction protein A